MYSSTFSRDAVSRATKTTCSRHSGRSASRWSYATNPRTMFFAGSMRSVRKISLRSPARVSNSLAASITASEAASRAKASGSGPSGAANHESPVRSRSRTSRIDSMYSRAHRVVWKPTGTAASDSQIASATCVGRTRIEAGPQKGVWAKYDTSRSGRAARTIPVRARVGSPAPGRVAFGSVGDTASANAWLTETYASHATENDSSKSACGSGRRARGRGTTGSRSRRPRSGVGDVGVEFDEHDVGVEGRLLRAVQHGAVTVGERGRDATRTREHVGGCGQRVECAGEATRSAVCGDPSVFLDREQEWSSVRDDDHARSSVNSRSQSSSSRVDRKFSRTCSRPCAPSASAPTGSASRSMVRWAHSSIESTR